MLHLRSTLAFTAVVAAVIMAIVIVTAMVEVTVVDMAMGAGITVGIEKNKIGWR
tara:strand:+ start:280523 stop:280684 length:162 start_codon:yes stop_codon:yes gene_type:complete